MIRRGVALVPEGRRLFSQMSIRENLELGGVGAGFSAERVRRRLHEVSEILPDTVRCDLARPAGSLSGGAQQMAAIARAMVTDPKALIVDEPSMGLAPVMIDRFYGILNRKRVTGISIVLTEQIAAEAIRRAERLFVTNRGRIDYAGQDKNAARDRPAATLSHYASRHVAAGFMAASFRERGQIVRA